LQKVVTRQIRLQGSCASAGEYPQAIALMASGAIRVKPLISAIAPLAEGPQWFERLYAREANLLKVVLPRGRFSGKTAIGVDCLTSGAEWRLLPARAAGWG